jgi:hypothetical protein
LFHGRDEWDALLFTVALLRHGSEGCGGKVLVEVVLLCHGRDDWVTLLSRVALLCHGRDGSDEKLLWVG